VKEAPIEEEKEQEEHQPIVTEQEMQQTQEKQEVHFHEKGENKQYLEQEHLKTENLIAEESIARAPDGLSSTLLEVADDDGDNREEEE